MLQVLLQQKKEGAGMEITKMRLADIRKPEKNVRIHTRQQIKEFRRSVEMFGQIRPIVIDEGNTILAGNGLYEALAAMGKDTADVCQLTGLTEKQKKKLMIADNKVFSLGIDNLDTLNCFLEEMQGDLDIPGFDEEILKQMVSEADEVTEKLSSYGLLDDAEIKAIRESAGKKPHLGPWAGQGPQCAVAEGQAPDTGQGQRQEGTAQGMGTGQGMPGGITDASAFGVGREGITCPNCGEKIWL